MKKCDIKGCKNKAEVFGETLAFCREHWNKITADGVDRGSEVFMEGDRNDKKGIVGSVYRINREKLENAVKAILDEIGADYVVISKQKLQEIKEKWKGLGESESAVNEVIREILEAEK